MAAKPILGRKQVDQAGDEETNQGAFARYGLRFLVISPSRSKLWVAGERE